MTGNVALEFRERAWEDGDRVAVALVRDPDDPGATESWTYRRLDRTAGAVAAHLRRRCRPGERVLLSYPSGPDFAAALLGCFLAGLIAVPAPLPGRQRRRLTAIARDAGITAVLASSGDRDAIAEWLSAEGPADAAPVFSDTLDPAPSDASSDARCDLAVLQYTSASTGVILTHDNILANVRSLTAPDELRVVCWLPLHHDMGLIGQLLAPLVRGGTTFLLDPNTFVRRPYTWLRTIDRYRATASAAPAFAFGLCVDRVTEDELGRLDLSSWRLATQAADRLDRPTMRRFADRFSAAGFRADLCPAYGLAEATMVVCGRRAPELRVLDGLVSCGRPHDIDLEIVDPDTLEPLPEDGTGEIWLRGVSVAAGYWGRPDRTQRTFGARTAGGDGPYLRTGDLGFRHDGELYLTGHLRDAVVVRGQKIYLADVESALRDEIPALPGPVTVTRRSERIVVAGGIGRTPAERLPDLARRVVHVVAREFGAPVAAVRFLRSGQTQPAYEHSLPPSTGDDR